MTLLAEKVSKQIPDKSIKRSKCAAVQTGTGGLLGLWYPGKPLSANPPIGIKEKLQLTREDYKALLIVMILALMARFHDLKNPPNVVFEEAAMGGYVNRYMFGKFFLDIEPPLPGIIYYGLAWFTRYKGTFPFRGQNETYIGGPFPYYFLRTFVATLGCLSVALTYATLKLTGLSRASAVLGSIFVIFDNSLATEFRYFLPNPLLIFSITLCVFLWKKLEIQRNFSIQWFGYLFALSSSLSVTVSLRSSGVYTLMFLVFLNLYQVWWMCADVRVSVKALLSNVIIRLSFLILIPIAVYVAVIMTHLILTPKSGDGDTFMSPEFQSTLIHNERPAMPSNISYGSFVTLRHMNSHSYLHSHDHYYPTGSFQQQVSLYGYRDLNNVWMVERIEDNKTQPETIGLQQVSDGDYIKLKHIQTGRRLHSHNIKAPVSDVDWQHEVSAYGADGYPGDLNDLWRVEIVQDLSEVGLSTHYLQTIRSVFRLRHASTNCLLFSHHTKLPKWGYQQQEVTCTTQGKLHKSLWFIEMNFNPKDDSTQDFVNYRKPTLAEKFVEYVDAMKVAADNNELQPFWQVESQKLPLLEKGMAYYFHHHRQVFVFGNWLIWYACIGAIVIYFIFKLFALVLVQRGHKDKIENLSNVISSDHHAGQFILGWFVTFCPLLIKKKARIVDYLPSLYFSILAFAVIWEFVLLQVTKKQRTRNISTVCLLIVVISVFMQYSHFVYGGRWTSQDCLKLQRTYDKGYHCDIYFNSIQEYDQYDQKNWVKYRYIPAPKEVVPPDNFVPRFEWNMTAPTGELLDLAKIGVPKLNLNDIRVQVAFQKQLDAKGITLSEFTERLKLNQEKEYSDDQEIDQIANEVIVQVNSEPDQEKIDSEVAEQWARITPPPKMAEATTTEETETQQSEE
jgi:dolichyl-phosphate-mannose-protein mannosyltransferase